MKVELVSWRGMYVTGVQRYIRSLWDALQKLDTDIEFTMRERKYWETHIFGKPVGGYASLLASHFLDKRADDDKILHAVAPMPLQNADVLTVHDLTPYKELWRYQNSIRQAVGWLLNLQSVFNARKIITPTEHVRQDVLRMCGKRPSDVYAIHEGVDTGVFRPLNLRRDMNIVLYVGDDNPRKEVDSLVNACAKVGFNLVWIGPCHWKGERKRILSSAERLGVELTELRSVTDEELVKWYNKCRVHAYVSSDEGFGLPLLEAAACGTVSVCSFIPPFREIMRDMVQFILPGDIDSIAHGLVEGGNVSKVVNSRLLTEHASKFTWRKTAEKTLAVYKEVGQC